VIAVQTFKKRSEIPSELTWNLANIFAQDEIWERDFRSLQSRLPELEKLQGTLSQSGEAFLRVLSKRDELFEELERLYVYTSMHKDEDTTNSKYQGMAPRSIGAFRS